MDNNVFIIETRTSQQLMNIILNTFICETPGGGYLSPYISYAYNKSS